MRCQKCLGDTAALGRRGWRGEGGAEEPFDVLPDHIGFEVHLIADALEGKGRLGPGVGDDGHGEVGVGQARHREADAVDGDGSLHDDVAQGGRIGSDGVPHGVVVALDAANRAHRVDVPRHQVSAESPVGRHGPLQVHGAAGMQGAEVAASQRLVHDIGAELGRSQRSDGEADAVHGDGVAQPSSLEHGARVNGQNGRMGAPAQRPYGADFLYNAGEHGVASLSTEGETAHSKSRSGPRAVTVGEERRSASAGSATPRPATGPGALAPPKSFGAI